MKRAIWLSLILTGVAGAETRRFALIVGENKGDNDDELLRYAEEDARRMLQVLESVGSVTPDRAVLLAGADADRVRAEMRSLAERLRRDPKPGDQLVVYFSGHADEGELHLRGTRLPLFELNDFIREAPVAVGLLIVDSCRSGAVTRLKGLKPADGPAIHVESAEITGRVIISSSGADEASQEAEPLHGSYFTHHLAAGLRGAADTSGDGLVTLDEAYAYAYAHTIESTFATRGGMQHPAYRVDLKGQGALVLADLRLADARLTIDVEPPGQWLITSADRRTVVAQVDKSRGRVVVALEAGDYRVGTREADSYLEASVTLPHAGSATVGIPTLERAPLPAVALKGSDLARLTAAAGVAGTTGIVGGLSDVVGGELRVFYSRPRLLGPLDTLTGTVAVRGGQAGNGLELSQQELEVRLGPGRGWQRGRFWIVVALEGEALLANQNGLPNGKTHLGLEGGLGLDLGAQVQLAGPLLLYLDLGASLLAVKKTNGLTPVPRAEGSGGIAFQF